MSTSDPADVPAFDAPDPTARAVYRRLSRALADVGIAPQPIGERVQSWASLIDGVVVFGALSIPTAARLASLLEDIASQLNTAVASPRDDFDNEPSGDFTPTFDPVAPPYEPGHGPSQFHPRTAR